MKSSTCIRPDFSRPGSYILILDRDSTVEALDEILASTRRISSGYMSLQGDARANVLNKVAGRFEIVDCSDHDINRLKRPRPIPRWLLAEANMKHVEAGDYHALRPVTAEVVPTLHCCFSCVQCSYSEPKRSLGLRSRRHHRSNRDIGDLQQSELHMSPEQMHKILSRLHEGSVRNVLFTGGGEPLVNAEATILGMSEARRMGMSFALYTNGLLLNETTARQILALGPVFVRVSIYGGCDIAFERYTRTPREGYASVLRNVALLIAMKRMMNSPVNIMLSFLVHPLTMIGFQNFPETLLATLGEDGLRSLMYIRFTPTVDYYHGKQHARKWMISQFSKIEDVAEAGLGRYVEVVPYRHRLRDLYSPRPYKRCRASGWYVEVGPSGDVYHCCETLFQGEYLIGNLVDETIDELFGGPRRSSIVDNVALNGCMNCPPVCKPHELNKALATVDSERARDGLVSFGAWRQDVLLGDAELRFFPGGMNDYES